MVEFIEELPEKQRGGRNRKGKSKYFPDFVQEQLMNDKKRRWGIVGAYPLSQEKSLRNNISQWKKQNKFPHFEFTTRIIDMKINLYARYTK